MHVEKIPQTNPPIVFWRLRMVAPSQLAAQFSPPGSSELLGSFNGENAVFKRSDS